MNPASNRIFLASAATAVPPFRADQPTVWDYFARHYTGRLKTRSLDILRKVLEHPSIEGRNFAVDDPSCLIDETPDDRIRRFTSKGVDLACRAARKALDRAGLSIGEVDALVINTCTGYICPGLTSYVAQELDMDRSVPAFDLVGGGCAGALPGLMVARGQLASRGGGAVLSVAVEVCSVTFQMGDDLSLLLSNALFGDGAAAVVLWTRPEGLEFRGTATRHLPEERESIRYVHRNGNLHNQLSTSLPRIMAPVVEETVTSLLQGEGITIGDVGYWALHGGGDSVINGIGSRLQLSEEQLAPTRNVLRRFGNMSSPSALFVLSKLMEGGMEKGGWVILAAFGAGMTAHAALFRVA